MAEITIKVGGVSIEASRQDLMEVNETADGVIFTFKGGLQLVYTQQFMTSTTKQIIKNTADNDKLSKQKLLFTLDNPKRPVLVIAN